MRTLVIDTATPALSVALWEDGSLLARIHEVIGRGHAERLVPALATLPDGGRAERVVAGVGPGSFTGTRVGLAVARALGLAWGAPVVGLSTLALVAAAHDGVGPVVALVNGGHGEAFAQVFETDPLRPASDLEAVPFQRLSAWVGDRAVVGAEALAAHLPHLTMADPDAARFDRVTALATLPPRVLYGRGPDAVPAA